MTIGRLASNEFLRGWMPAVVTRRVRGLAVVSFVMQVLLIFTGGAVRLTASGLGCPDWPYCTSTSFTNTPELGIHGFIEFGNRLLTGVIVVVVILMFLAVVRMRATRRDLFWLALAQGLSIPVQAVIGGISVLSGLNPYVVGLHFVVSMLLVVLTAALVYRTRNGARGSELLVPRWFRSITLAAVVTTAITVIFGILTTGSGPHAGDNSNPKKLAPRNGLDPVLLQHVHSWPAYATFALTLVLVVSAIVLGRRGVMGSRILRASGLLLVVEFAQIVVGLVQARYGLPIALVNIHLVLAALLVAAVTALVLTERTSRADGLTAVAASTAVESVRPARA